MGHGHVRYGTRFSPEVSEPSGAGIEVLQNLQNMSGTSIEDFDTETLARYRVSLQGGYTRTPSKGKCMDHTEVSGTGSTPGNATGIQKSVHRAQPRIIRSREVTDLV